MRQFIYVDEHDVPVMVRAKSQPTQHNVPQSGTWIISELFGRPGEMRWTAVAEITWGTLKKLRFIGEIPATPSGEGRE